MNYMLDEEIGSRGRYSENDICYKLLVVTVRVTLDGNSLIPSKAVQEGFCRFITQLLLGTGTISSNICSV